MDDGTKEEFGPGDAAVIPPGHNAWVVGNGPVVGIDSMSRRLTLIQLIKMSR